MHNAVLQLLGVAPWSRNKTPASWEVRRQPNTPTPGRWLSSSTTCTSVVAPSSTMSGSWPLLTAWLSKNFSITVKTFENTPKYHFTLWMFVLHANVFYSIHVQRLVCWGGCRCSQHPAGWGHSSVNRLYELLRPWGLGLRPHQKRHFPHPTANKTHVDLYVFITQ